MTRGLDTTGLILQALATSHYEVLGVSVEVSPDQLRRAFHAASRMSHPDKNSKPEAAAAFRQVSEAYEVLNDPVKRRVYDAEQRQPPLTPCSKRAAAMTAAAAAQEYTHRRQTSLEQEVAFLREDNTRLRKQLAAESAHEFAHQLKQSQQEVQALHDEVARYRATMDAVVQDRKSVV